MHTTALISVKLFLLISSVSAAFMKNTYVFDVEQFEACPDNENLEAPLRDLQFRKVNRTHRSLTYTFTYPYDIDETVGAALVLERWGDGGWITMPFIPYQKNMCDAMMRYFKDTTVVFHKALGVKEPDQCPIPAGTYGMKNFVIDLSHMTTIPFWSGRFRFTFYAQKEGHKRKLYCIRFVFTSKEVYNER